MVQTDVTRTDFATRKDEVVVSGISVRFPESGNIDEFRDNLFNKVDMVTEDNRRWPIGLWNLPGRSGKLKDLASFDAKLFGIDDHEADLMDPNVRLALECTFEAIVDAGLLPNDLKGSKTGVFMGNFFSEIDGSMTSCEGDAINYRQTWSRYINYIFDFRGPSALYDTACSSSFAAMTEALHYLRLGEIDYAIVAGCNVPLSPGRCLQFLRFNMLSKAGKCNFLDADGNGYVKAESVAITLLQKKRDAKRIYATIVNAKSNTDGYKEDGVTFPKWTQQFELMKEAYEEAGVEPGKVAYIEAHGTGTQAGDTQEAQALCQMFCEGTDRHVPLLVGSVKTNMGHCEAASGLSSLAKVIIAYETRMIPPMIHFKTPNPNIPSLINGRIAPVTEAVNFAGGYVGINNFGFGGSNNHIIVHHNEKESKNESYELFTGVDGVHKLPRLVLCCGRTEFAATYLSSALKKMHRECKLTVDFLDLVNNFSKLPSSSLMNYRSGLLISENSLSQLSVCEVSSQRRPLWFVFPGLGSQWSQMGRALMQIDSFAKSIEQSAQIINKHLLPYEVNLTSLLTGDGKVDIEESPLAGVALAAFQIALLDVLKELGLEPDGYLGHSIGELGCGYADGCLSREQMLMSTLHLHQVVTEANLKPGLMVAVGMSEKDASEQSPLHVWVACDNSDGLVTLSGSYDETKKFGSQLRANGIFVKDVKSCGIAFHCAYMDQIKGSLNEAFVRLLDPEPKTRSSKWVSTSLPPKVNSSQVTMADYYINNLVSPVLFREACKKIPEDAVIIEISPQSFFASILKLNMSGNQEIIPLLKRNDNQGNIEKLFSGLGRLYQAGQVVNIEKLYRKVEYPLPRGTPSLAPLIKLDHSKPRLVRLYPNFFNSEPFFENVVTVDITSQEWDFLVGHRIDGRILFPATGYLYLVWNMFAKVSGYLLEEMPVEFFDVKISRATIMNTESPTKFDVALMQKTNAYCFLFTIEESGSLVASGSIKRPVIIQRQSVSLPKSNCVLKLNHDDIYRELKIRGYEYGKSFRHINEATSDGSSCKITWTDKWITFADNFLQLVALSQIMRGLYLPVGFQSMTCYPGELFGQDVATQIDVYYDQDTNRVAGTGLEIEGMSFSLAPKKSMYEQDVVEEYKFVPLDERKFQSSSENLRRPLIDLAIENTTESDLKVVEVSLSAGYDFDDRVHKILASNSSINFEYKLLVPTSYEPEQAPQGVQVLNISANLSSIGSANILILKMNSQSVVNGALLQQLSTLEQGNFLYVETERGSKEIDDVYQDITVHFILISTRRSEDTNFSLWRKTGNASRGHNNRFIDLSSNSFEWIKLVQDAIVNSSNDTVWLRSADSHQNGLIGFFNCLKKEPATERFRCFLISDKNAPSDLHMNEMFFKDLKVNILKDGQLGTFRHLTVSKDKEVEASCEHAYLNVKTVGDLTSFKWFESSFNRKQNMSGRQFVNVHYSALNFKDVMLASGKLSMDSIPKEMTDRTCVIGLEFAGLSDDGQRVAGIVGSKGLATTVRVEDPDFLWTVPDSWSLEEAATVPVVYATAYYALIMRGKLMSKETVLIHSGSGGVGQAAISICLSMGCTVFTTTGSQEKREYLKSAFPRLTNTNFASSRDLCFEEHVMRETNGLGVDVILNSLAEEKLQASARCLAVNGRFLEIGKFDLSQDNKLEASLLSENKTFHGIFLDSLFNFDRESDSQPLSARKDKLLLHNLMSEGFSSGIVKPLKRTVFGADQVEDAFRFMANGKHIGKVLIQIRDENNPQRGQINAIRQTFFDNRKSYVIAGGLGGFGLEIARWMTERGARNLVLSSRKGAVTTNQLWTLSTLTAHGVRIEVLKQDVGEEADVREILKKAQTLGPVGGIFNLAMVLRDGLFENQTVQSFEESCRPKVRGTRNLDKLSRDLCPDLDYFVVFSSVSCGKGNAGQTNYGYANSFMERICEKRRGDGLPGLAIQWGAIGDVGVLASNLTETDKEIVIGGTKPQRILSCTHNLDKMLQLRAAVVTCYSPAFDKKSATLSGDENLVDKIAHIIGIKDQSTLSAESGKTLGELGIDSLMAIEIKQTLERVQDRTFNVQQLRQLTVAELHNL